VNEQRHREPLSYYHRTGPFGQAFEAYAAHPAGSEVGVIGLGAGAMICYALPGQHWTFYEIDPAVLQVARSTPFFSYLRDSTNVIVEHKLGDARLRLREATDGVYGLLICDAFSSDVPPLHLITKEAFDLYLRKLAPDGLLCFNISSRYLDFRPVLGNLAQANKLYALSNYESEVTPEAQREGKYASHWVVMARSPRLFGKLMDDARWQPVLADPTRPLWTDDYSNVLSIFQWQ
jgi:spermidine synthase